MYFITFIEIIKMVLYLLYSFVKNYAKVVYIKQYEYYIMLITYESL